MHASHPFFLLVHLPQSLRADLLCFDLHAQRPLQPQGRDAPHGRDPGDVRGVCSALHRLRVRNIESRPAVGRYQMHYSHEFYPWRKFFNMSRMQGDVLVHDLIGHK